MFEECALSTSAMILLYIIIDVWLKKKIPDTQSTYGKRVQMRFSQKSTKMGAQIHTKKFEELLA